MLTLNIREKNGEERQLVFDKEEVTIGRASGSDIVLPRNNISKRHARLVDKHDKVVIVDLRSTNGTYVNGRRITAPELLTPDDKVYIGDFVIRLAPAVVAPVGRRTEDFGTRQPVPAPVPAAAPDPRMEHAPTVAVGAATEGEVDEDAANRAIAAIEKVELAEMGPPGPPPMPPPERDRLEDEEEEEEATQALSLADVEAVMAAAPTPVADPVASDSARAYRPPSAPQAPLPAAPEPVLPAAPEPALPAAPEPALPAASEPALPAAPEPAAPEQVLDLDAWDEWNATVAVVLEAIERRLPDDVAWEDAEEEASGAIERLVASGEVAADVEREPLVQDVVTELVGLGPLADLLADDEVERVVVDGMDVIRVWRRGVVEPYGRVFSHGASYERVIGRLLAMTGIPPETAPPVVDGMLPQGTSLQVVRPPVSSHNTAVVLRRARAHPTTLEDLEAQGALTAPMAQVMRQAVADRASIVVAGPPGSGRTTLLGALLAAAPVDERLVVVGEARAPLAPQPDVVRLDRNVDEAECADVYALALKLGADRLVIDDVDASNVVEYTSLALTAGAPVIAAAREPDVDRLLKRLALQLELSKGAAFGQRAQVMLGEAMDVVICLAPQRGGGPVVSRIVEVQGTKDGYGLRVLAKRAQSA